MKIDYKHGLTPEEAYGRINNLLSELKSQYADKISDHQSSWNSDHTQMDFSIKVMGFSAKGQICLGEGQVTLEGKLPLMARMFKGKIERMIEKQLVDILS